MPRRKREKTVMVRMRKSLHNKIKIEASKKGVSIIKYIEQKLK